jgi:hypothetical protein
MRRFIVGRAVVEMLIRPLILPIVAFAGQPMKIAGGGDFSRKIGYHPGVLESGSHGRPPWR